MSELSNDANKHAAAFLSGAATSPSQQAPGPFVLIQQLWTSTQLYVAILLQARNVAITTAHV